MMQQYKVSTVLALIVASSVMACNHNGSQEGGGQSVEGSGHNTGSVHGVPFTPASALFLNVNAAIATTSTAADPNVVPGDFNTLGGDANAVAGDFNTLAGDANAQVGDTNITANPNAAAVAPGNANGTLPETILLGLLSSANACEDQQNNQASPNASGLLFVLAGITQPGTYNVTVPATTAPAGSVMATSVFLPEAAKSLSGKKLAAAQAGTVVGSFVTENASCNPTPTAVQSGTVTFTTFDGSKSLVGSYDVTLASGDKLSGTFNAVDCPKPANTTAAPTCSN